MIERGHLPWDKLRPRDTILFIDVSRPKKMGFLLFIVFAFFVSETISITLFVRIIGILKTNMGSFSHNAYKVHRQFTILIGVQLLIPIVFVILPVTTCIVFIYMGRLISSLSIKIGFLMLSSYGFFNGLFTIVFVSNYRWHAYQVCAKSVKELVVTFRISSNLG